MAETTNRGFRIDRFEDAYGVECSLQESSLAADEGHVWFGASDIGLKHFKAGDGWRDVELPHSVAEHYSANNRMHLSQSQVAALLPALQHFAEHGVLPND